MVASIFMISYAKENSKEKEYTFAAWNSPPYVFTSEKIEPKGIFVDIVNSACKKLNVICNVEVLPYKRLINNYNAGIIFGAFPLTKTEEREKISIFSEPVVNCELGLFVRKENHDVITNSNYKKILNDYLVSSFGPSITFSKLENIARDVPNIQLYMDVKIETSFLKLNRNHIETSSKETKAGIFIDKKIGKYLIKFNNLENIRYAGKLSSFDYHIIFDKKNKNLNFVTKFNQTLASMKAKGEIDKIISSY
jgi:polar amino acid transport system substrate-binding protein